jgi:ferredoxin
VPKPTIRRSRLRVDPLRCTAFGFCAEFAPELFALDDWGYAWLRRPDVPPQDEGLAREAAKLCPKRAILLETVETT